MNGTFFHMVYFWLKEPDNQQHRQKFEESIKRFIDGSDYVLMAHIGTPAMTPRAVVDNTYTYDLVVSFQSKEVHDAYQQEQVHLNFIAECKDLWDRVLIYDSITV